MSRSGLRRTVAVWLALQAMGAAAQEPLVNENLLQDLPAGWAVAGQNEQDGVWSTEMRPRGEAPGQWTARLITRVLLGLQQGTPQALRAAMQARAAERCPDGRMAEIAEGEENGYPFALWIQDCAADAGSERPVSQWTKAIQGSDSFYIVELALRSAPNDLEVLRWTRYFASVRVCDSRRADRPCPGPGPQAG